MSAYVYPALATHIYCIVIDGRERIFKETKFEFMHPPLIR